MEFYYLCFGNSNKNVIHDIILKPCYSLCLLQVIPLHLLMLHLDHPAAGSTLIAEQGTPCILAVTLEPMNKSEKNSLLKPFKQITLYHSHCLGFFRCLELLTFAQPRSVNLQGFFRYPDNSPPRQLSSTLSLSYRICLNRFKLQT